MKKNKIASSQAVLVIIVVILAFLSACTPTNNGKNSAGDTSSEPANEKPHATKDRASDSSSVEAAITVKTLEDLPEGINVVQYEMQQLTGAMQNILQHIADNRLESIPTEINKVHPIYELTHEALEKGLYAPPYNSEQLDAFKAQDHAFHDDLVSLVRASRAKNLAAATTAYGKLVEGCTSCHTQYRFPQ